MYWAFVITHTKERLNPMKHSVSEKKIKNGIKILFIDIPDSNNFDLAITFKSGYRFATKDDPAKYEIPHILEHLVFDGSNKYPTSDMLQDVFSSGGGASNGFTTAYHNIFAFHNRIRNAEDVLRAGLDMVFFPKLTKQSFDEEYKVVDNELNDNLGDFVTAAADQAMQQALKDLQTSCDIQIDRLPNVVHDDVKPYHEKYYGTANTTLIIAADFSKITKSRFESIILEETKNAKGGTDFQFPKFEVSAANPKLATSQNLHRSIVDTIACAAFMTKGVLSQREMLSLGLMASIINGMKSYSVNHKLRKQGLVYGITFTPSQSIEIYGLELDIAANNDKFIEVYAYTLEAIKDFIHTGITDQQFSSARQEFIESFEDGTNSTDDIMGWYLQDYLMEGSVTTPEQYMAEAKTITQKEMLTIAQKLFVFDNLYQSVFSAKAIRVSNSMELLSKAILNDGVVVTPKLISENSLPINTVDKKYKAVMGTLLVSLLSVFMLPIGNWDGSLSEVFLHELTFPWNFIAPVYFLTLFIMLVAMEREELRKFIAQMVFVFIAWLLIEFLSAPTALMQPFNSSDPLTSLQAWTLVYILGITAVAAIYGARSIIIGRIPSKKKE